MLALLRWLFLLILSALVWVVELVLMRRGADPRTMSAFESHLAWAAQNGARSGLTFGGLAGFILATVLAGSPHLATLIYITVGALVGFLVMTVFLMRKEPPLECQNVTVRVRTTFDSERPMEDQVTFSTNDNIELVDPAVDVLDVSAAEWFSVPVSWKRVSRVGTDQLSVDVHRNDPGPLERKKPQVVMLYVVPARNILACNPQCLDRLRHPTRRDPVFRLAYKAFGLMQSALNLVLSLAVDDATHGGGDLAGDESKDR